MGVPTARTDLSAVAASNSPAGSDTVSPSTGPANYLRAHAACIRQNYDDLQAKAPLDSPSFTGTAAFAGPANFSGAVALPVTWSIDGVTVTATANQINNASSIADAELAAIAGLTSAADRLPYFTGSGTAALAVFTSAARDLLDDADAAAMRTTLGTIGSASPTFTGTVTMPTTQYGNSAISQVKTLIFNSEYNAGSGTAITPNFANGQKQYCTMGNGTTTITLNTGNFPGVGHYQLRIIQYSTAKSLSFDGTAYSASRWLNDADANDVNMTNSGESILSIYWNGTAAYLSMSKIGAV
jgi:hypothetical protein